MYSAYSRKCPKKCEVHFFDEWNSAYEFFVDTIEWLLYYYSDTDKA